MKKTMKKTAGMQPAVMQSAQQIWLAGLGAFAMAGKEGNRLFEELVRRGHDVQDAGKSRLTKLLTRAEKRAQDLRGEARARLGKVRLPLDKGMTAAMHRLGIPTRSEILDLTKRVEALTRAVQKKDGHARRETKAAKPAGSSPTTAA